MIPRAIVAVIAGLLLVSCGGDDLSLAEYNTEGLALGATMEERIYELDAELDPQTATVEDVRTYWDQRIEAYGKALEGYEALQPAAEAAELHGKGMELFAELVAAESALATRVVSFDMVTSPEQWWNTPEGEAVGAVDP